MDLQLKFENEDGVLCNDLLYSDKYVNEFYTIVTNSSYPVYAVSGSWGTGKTCFVKMWENLLKEKGIAYVHIDAFKMDYETEPFIMFIRAFNKYMLEKKVDKNKRKELLIKAKKAFSLTNIAKLGLSVLLDKTLGLESVNEFIGNAFDTCFEITAEQSLYDDLQSSLEEILTQEKTLYIIIDELDRCRPDFALETLERIKHIFHVKNVKYILVYNEEIMASMINKKYGVNINAYRYLDKFVQKTYSLDNTRRIKQFFMHELDNSKEKFTSFSMVEFLEFYAATIFKIFNAYDLKLRDIQQILCNLKQYSPNFNDNLYTVIVSMEIFKQIDKKQYETMLDYYNENKTIVNMPSTEIFNKIFNVFKEQLKSLEDISTAFIRYIEYIEHR